MSQATDIEDPQDRAAAYRVLNRILFALGVLGVLWALGHRQVAEVIPGELWACRSMSWFGHPCAFCGVTRGVGAALRGDLGAAVSFHPLAIGVLALGILELLYRGVMAWVPVRAERAARLSRSDSRIHLVLAGLMLVYSIGFAIHSWFFA